MTETGSKNIGLWIPPEIMGDDNLTLIEKVFLADILFLDYENYCFAKNKHFSDRFNIGIPRSSQVVSSLVEKKYITRHLKYKGGEVDERILTPSKILKGAYKKAKDRIQRNAKVIDNYQFKFHANTLATLLLKLILKRKADFKKPDLKKWAKHIDSMMRIDKRKPEKIEQVIRWSQADTFWQNNILSTSSLRKQFDQLELKMMKGAKKNAKITKQERFEDQQSKYGYTIQA